MDKNYVEINGEKIRVYQLCECDAVAARDDIEAQEWYKNLTGLDDDDLYTPEEVEIVSPEMKVRKSEEDDGMIEVREIVEEYWIGEPFIAVTSMY